MARVVIENISMTYALAAGGEVEALRGVSLTIEDGELLVLVGPSGSGKTTLLRVIAGLEIPTAGLIRFDGQPVQASPAEKRGVAMVFQDGSLYPHMTVRENLGFGLKLRKAARAEIDARVNEAAELLGVQDLFDRKPETLAGGERQRVALGRAIVLRPRILLLDEPLSSLDAPTRAQIRREIARLNRRIGLSMLYVTHDQVEAMTLAHRLAVIQNGAVQQVGSPMDTYAQPANRFVAGFIGAPPMNFFAGNLLGKDGSIWFQGEEETAESGLALCLAPANDSRLARHMGAKVLLGIRAENIGEVHGEPSRIGSGVVVAGTVEAIEPFGWETHVCLRIGSARCIARFAPTTSAKTGDQVRVELDPRQCQVFDRATGRVLE